MARPVFIVRLLTIELFPNCSLSWGYFLRFSYIRKACFKVFSTNLAHKALWNNRCGLILSWNCTNVTTLSLLEMHVKEVDRVVEQWASAFVWHEPWRFCALRDEYVPAIHGCFARHSSFRSKRDWNAQTFGIDCLGQIRVQPEWRERLVILLLCWERWGLQVVSLPNVLVFLQGRDVEQRICSLSQLRLSNWLFRVLRACTLFYFVHQWPRNNLVDELFLALSCVLR